MQSVRDVLRQRIYLGKDKEGAGDAIRAGCAEAKPIWNTRAQAEQDAIRAGCAEAKQKEIMDAFTQPGCNPCGMC